LIRSGVKRNGDIVFFELELSSMPRG